MHVTHSAISNSGKPLPDFPRLMGTKRQWRNWSPGGTWTMRRVRLVRALVMRGQSHCQTSSVKVGRERGQYTWTSPHPAGTSLASPNLKSAGRGAQRKQSQRSVSPAQNVAEKGRKLIQTWKVGREKSFYMYYSNLSIEKWVSEKWEIQQKYHSMWLA